MYIFQTLTQFIIQHENSLTKTSTNPKVLKYWETGNLILWLLVFPKSAFHF